MKIAIISDSHDQIPHLAAAVLHCNSFGISMIIHCGDLISPFMLDELAGFNGITHLVYGNNVGDQHLISQWCGTRFPNIIHHGVLGAVEAAGKKIVFHHYPEIARALAAQGKFDIACCGHNHKYTVETIGGTLLINPGELLGKEGQPTFAVCDSTTMEVSRIEVGAPLFTLTPLDNRSNAP